MRQVIYFGSYPGFYQKVHMNNILHVVQLGPHNGFLRLVPVQDPGTMHVNKYMYENVSDLDRATTFSAEEVEKVCKNLRHLGVSFFFIYDIDFAHIVSVIDS